MHTKLVVIGLLVGIVGCSVTNEQEPKPDEGDTSHAAGAPSVPAGGDAGSLDALIEDVGEIPVEPPQPKQLLECDECSAQQEGNYACSYAKYSETAAMEDIVALQPNSAGLWPGNLVRGDAAQRGELVPLGVASAPVRFSVSLENISGSPVGEMMLPTLSAFREERNRILAAELRGAQPAQLAFSISQVSSASQLSLAVGASAEWPLVADIAATFDFQSRERRTKLVLSLTQTYYTIDIDTRNRPSEYFAADVTTEDLVPLVTEDSPPLYVQSISYGRRVLFTIESSESVEEVRSALEASYNAIAVNVDGQVAESQRRSLSEARIQAFVFGGSGAAAAKLIDGFDGLRQYVLDGGEYSKDSPGAPIAYKLAYLDNTPARFALSSEYIERTCMRNRVNLTAKLKEIKDHSPELSSAEFFGWVDVLYPSASHAGGCSYDLDTDPSALTLIYYERGQYWVNGGTVDRMVSDVPVSDSSAICLRAQLWEADVDPDDDYGFTELEIPWGSWQGSHTLQLRNEGNQADVEIEIKAE